MCKLSGDANEENSLSIGRDWRERVRSKFAKRSNLFGVESQSTDLHSNPTFAKTQAVRRQGFWNQLLPKLRDRFAHLVGLIMRRVVCDASVAFRASFV